MYCLTECRKRSSNTNSDTTGHHNSWLMMETLIYGKWFWIPFFPRYVFWNLQGWQLRYISVTIFKTLWPLLDFDLQFTLHQLPSNQPTISPPPRAQMNWWFRGNGFYIITKMVSLSPLSPPAMWVTQPFQIYFSPVLFALKLKAFFSLILLALEITYLRMYIPCLSFSVSKLFNCLLLYPPCSFYTDSGSPSALFQAYNSQGCCTQSPILHYS